MAVSAPQQTAILLAAVDAHPPPPPFALRPLDLGTDLDFLLALYGDSRAREMALLPWPDEHKSAFLAAQFTAQHADYQTRFADRRFLVVLRRGRPMGRLYVAQPQPGCLRIVDLSIAAMAQGKGHGTALLRWLAGICAGAGAVLELHVRRDNPARALYARLGFTPASEAGPYELMRRPPAAVS